MLYNLEPQIKVMEHWCCTPCGIFVYPIIPSLYGESFPGFKHFRTNSTRFPAFVSLEIGDVFDLQVIPVMPAAHSWMDSMVWWGNSGELWKLDLGSTLMCLWEDEFDALKIIKGDFSKWGIPFWHGFQYSVMVVYDLDDWGPMTLESSISYWKWR